MYSEACQIYKEEGGQDELGKQNVKVHHICALADEQNRIQNLRFGKVKSAPGPRHTSSDDESSGNPHRRTASPLIPESGSSPPLRFRTLMPGEQIDFDGFRGSVTHLEDQCHRLMGSLEEACRTIEDLTKERDHFREFWVTMKNYHSVMSRFHTSSPPSAPYHSPASSYHPPMTSLLPLPPPPPPLTNAQFMVSQYPLAGYGPTLAGPSGQQYLFTGGQYCEPFSAQAQSQQNTAIVHNESHPRRQMTPSSTTLPSQNPFATNLSPPPSRPEYSDTPTKRDAVQPIDAYFGKVIAGHLSVKDGNKVIEQDNKSARFKSDDHQNNHQPAGITAGLDGDKVYSDAKGGGDGDENDVGDGVGDGDGDDDGDGDGDEDENEDNRYLNPSFI